MKIVKNPCTAVGQHKKQKSVRLLPRYLEREIGNVDARW